MPEDSKVEASEVTEEEERNKTEDKDPGRIGNRVGESVS